MSTCPTCSAALAPDQRYCLSCGEPCASRLGELLRPVAERAPDHRESSSRAASPSSRRSTALPTPRVGAALVLVMLGFGVVVGGAASPTVSDSLAAAALGPLTLVLPAAPAPVEEAADAEAPAVEEAATPESGDAPADASGTRAEPAPVPAVPPADEEAEPAPDAEPTAAQPTAKHVFVLSLGPGKLEALLPRVPYLRTLARRGALLRRYTQLDPVELPNELALLAGVAPNDATRTDCFDFTACVFAPGIPTLAEQVMGAGGTWKAYVESQGSAPCRRPAGDSTADPSWLPAPGDPYVTWRNPFVYFPSLTSTACAHADVGLDALEADLGDPAKAPTLSWIVPDTCHDGRPTVCADGAPAGPAALHAWLAEWAAKIVGSEAYADGGLLLVVPDASGTPEDLVSGALVLAEWVTPGDVVDTEYDPYSLLATLDDVLGLCRLGRAAGADVRSITEGSRVGNALVTCG